MVSIFEYLDYRKYLADYYRFKKIQNHRFSYRILADRAGIASTGYFSEVASGQRNLTVTHIPKLAKAFGLNEREQDFLAHLVDFNHAKTSEEKQITYLNLIRLLPAKAYRLKQSQLEYFSKWYYVAVREALAIHEVRENGEELARLLRPNITPFQAKSALKLLDKLKLISKDEQGRWLVTQSSLLSQNDDSAAFMVKAFQGEMLDLAKRALLDIPRNERDITTNTMSISDRGFEQVKSILKDCHNRIMDVVRLDSGENRVVQLNLQLFPLTYVKDIHNAS